MKGFKEGVAEGIRPPERLTVDKWADRYRILSSKSAAEVGRWRTSRTPYLKEIMECLSPQSNINTVVFMKGAQIGATECINNWIGYCVHQTPAPMLFVLPNLDVVDKYAETKLKPLIESTPELQDRFAGTKSRDSRNTKRYKDFPGGFLALAGAEAPGSLRSLSIRFLACDEVDGFPASAGTEGDPVKLAIQRTATFSNKKICLVSTPTLKGYSRIETAFEEGDKRFYNVPCPHCGEFQKLQWVNLKFTKDIESNPPIVTDAWIECVHCFEKDENGKNTDQKSKIYNYQKTEMLANGKWIAENPRATRTASFHLSSLYSPVGWYSWIEMAQDFIDSKKDADLLKVWVNTKLGESWEDQSGIKIDPTGLIKRCEKYEGDLIPKDVACLTCGVDVQDNRLELEIKGWGRGEESYTIDYRVIYGDPSGYDVWKQLDLILMKEFPHSLENCPPLRILATCVDSGGHYTDAVLSYCAARTSQRIWAIKGSSKGFGVPIFPANASLSKKKKAPLYVIGVNDAKDTIMHRLHNEQPGTVGYFHFNQKCCDFNYFDQLTGEVVRPKMKNGRPVREFVPKKAGQAVEVLDCNVYALAALRGLYRNFHYNLNAEVDGLIAKFGRKKSSSKKINKKIIAEKTQKSNNEVKIKKKKKKVIYHG